MTLSPDTPHLGVVPHPRVRAVIFDMDGLLVDSEPFWLKVQVAIMDSVGADIRPLVAQGLTMGMRVDESVALFRSRVPWEGAKDEELVEQIVAGVVRAIEEGAVLLPGVLDALELFEENGLALALASGSTPPVVDAVLDRFGLRGRFQVVSSAVDDVLGKPHPAIFLRTAAALGVDPLECAVLEDSVNGCVAAKAARMRVIAVPAAHLRQDPRFGVADLVLESLEELRAAPALALLGLAASPRPMLEEAP